MNLEVQLRTVARNARRALVAAILLVGPVSMILSPPSVGIALACIAIGAVGGAVSWLDHPIAMLVATSGVFLFGVPLVTNALGPGLAAWLPPMLMAASAFTLASLIPDILTLIQRRKQSGVP